MSERRDRESFFLGAGAYTPYVAVESGDEIYFVSTEDIGVGKDLFAKRTRVDLKVLAEALELLDTRAPGGVFVDVGANIGTTTVAAVRRHGFSSAIAIEPSATNVRTLAINVAANGLQDAVRVVHAAASNAGGEVLLALSEGTSGENAVVEAGDGVRVPAVTVDGVVGDAPVGMLWIDAQGHEASVLRGARRLLDRGVPVVCAVRRQRGWEDTRASLPGLFAGYTDVFRLRKQGNRYPIGELSDVLDAVNEGADVLVVRR